MSSGMYEDGIKALALSNSAPKSLPQPDRSISVDNPFCGDRIDLQVNLEEGRVVALAQDVRGCMLCQASANALADAAVGACREEIELVSARLTAMLKSDDKIACPSPCWEPLALFEPVAKYKSRHGCVTLPFKALLEAFA